MTVKDLNYYLSLDYDVVVARMEEDGEIVYKAYSNDLDSYVFYGAGVTKFEALQSFEECKKELFASYLAEGRMIPEPTREDKTLPSGKFLTRIDPRIHQRLVQIARKRKKSLNSLVDQVLVSFVSGEDFIGRVVTDLAKVQKPSYQINVYRTETDVPEVDYMQQYSSDQSDNVKVA